MDAGGVPEPRDRGLPLWMAAAERAASSPARGYGQSGRTTGEPFRAWQKQFFPSINFKLVYLRNHWGFCSLNKTVSV